MLDIKPLSEKDLARLHTKFILPIIVSDMLSCEEELDETAEFAMNEILSELCPDSALLCIAMCSLQIALETKNLPISKALENAAETIIDEYAPLWIAHEQNPDAFDEENIINLLSDIPEDFESLRDLLAATQACLEEDHCIAAILCDILSEQADYHRDIAEADLAAIKRKQGEKQSGKKGESGKTQMAIKEKISAAGSANIVVFPAKRSSVFQTARI